jgi:hypothetical protein
LGGLFAVAA